MKHCCHQWAAAAQALLPDLTLGGRNYPKRWASGSPITQALEAFDELPDVMIFPVTRNFDANAREPFVGYKVLRRDVFSIFFIPVDCPLGVKCPDGYCCFAHSSFEKMFHPICFQSQACFNRLKCPYLEMGKFCSYYHDETTKRAAYNLWRFWETWWYGWRDYEGIIRAAFDDLERSGTAMYQRVQSPIPLSRKGPPHVNANGFSVLRVRLGNNKTFVPQKPLAHRNFAEIVKSGPTILGKILNGEYADYYEALITETCLRQSDASSPGHPSRYSVDLRSPYDDDKLFASSPQSKRNSLSVQGGSPTASSHSDCSAEVALAYLKLETNLMRLPPDLQSIVMSVQLSMDTQSIFEQLWHPLHAVGHTVPAAAFPEQTRAYKTDDVLNQLQTSSFSRKVEGNLFYDGSLELLSQDDFTLRP
ncbi:MAG: hypothetical protein KVP17_001751 [Porospora cf. gigantea B]|uniref:uncharacterized protein n=1 Tax=Porospora cf. gigantea B TaxID=2853592 RepID=UPI003571AFD1|nr:MAG: hypothetical protein KVP17_001751 [Porospora cf. gigantea B]